MHTIITLVQVNEEKSHIWSNEVQVPGIDEDGKKHMAEMDEPDSVTEYVKRCQVFSFSLLNNKYAIISSFFTRIESRH